MYADASSNPIRRKLMGLRVLDADVQTLQGLKAAFQEANCVFRADPHHRDMVIEFFIAGLKAIRLLKG
jgi:hypothetical protein